jgi:hypothetical protein
MLNCFPLKKQEKCLNIWILMILWLLAHGYMSKYFNHGVLSLYWLSTYMDSLLLHVGPVVHRPTLECHGFLR